MKTWWRCVKAMKLNNNQLNGKRIWIKDKFDDESEKEHYLLVSGQPKNKTVLIYSRFAPNSFYSQRKKVQKLSLGPYFFKRKTLVPQGPTLVP